MRSISMAYYNLLKILLFTSFLSLSHIHPHLLKYFIMFTMCIRSICLFLYELCA